MKTRKKRSRKVSSEETRHEALTLYVNLKNNANETSRKLSIPQSTLYAWIKENPEIIKNATEELLLKQPNSLNLKQGLDANCDKVENMIETAKNQLIDRLIELIPHEKDISKLTYTLTAIIPILAKEEELKKTKRNTFADYINKMTFTNPADEYLTDEELKDEP